MEYINLENKTPEEHYEAVKQLISRGFRYSFNTFGNPHFVNWETGEEVCIISGILEPSGYFAI